MTVPTLSQVTKRWQGLIGFANFYKYIQTSLRKKTITATARAMGFSKDDVSKLFNLLSNATNELPFDARHNFHCRRNQHKC